MKQWLSKATPGNRGDSASTLQTLTKERITRRRRRRRRRRHRERQRTTMNGKLPPPSSKMRSITVL